MLSITKKYVTIPTFIKIIGNLSNKSVLDLACGDGFFTRILAKLKPKEIIGADISKELIKIAIEKEKKEKLGIKYLTKNVLELNLNKKFDVITAVFLLNYAKTKEELLEMCKTIYSHLNNNGKFCAIAPHSAIKVMKNFEYERRFTNVNGKGFFIDGDKIKCEMREKGKKPFEFVNYYWSKKTYGECLRKAGFQSLEWVKAIVSKEGVKKYGTKYWENFKNNPSVISIICKK